MLVAGQIVEVTVQRVEVFGAFCQHQDQEVLLRIPETSWVASYCSCDQFTAPGDQLTVLILHVDSRTGQASATVRGLYPDPWAGGVLEPGREHIARVVRLVPRADRCGNRPGVLLELVPGAFVMLCGRGEDLYPRCSARVVVLAFDRSRRSVVVGLCE